MNLKNKVLLSAAIYILIIVASFISKHVVSAVLVPGEKPETIVFQRRSEPKENAFSLLIPKGWIIEGGIQRVNPLTQGGAAQSIVAKLDMTVKNNEAGNILIRWLPDVLFMDMRYSHAAAMFPTGSNYNGMTVCPILPPAEFVQTIVIPYAHPNATNVVINDQKALADIASKYQQYSRNLIPGSDLSYQAAIISLTYNENGTSYQETIVTVIENWGSLGAGMWGNKETFLIRTPLDKYDDWAPVFSIMQNSVELNLQWIVGEIQGQAQRGQIAIQTQQEMERIGNEITQHRQQTNSEIHNDMFLTLTDQEEYVNPYTQKVESGSNQWQNRWVNESGDIIYTNNESYNPNTDINLNRSDFKRTPIRERKPGN